MRNIIKRTHLLSALVFSQLFLVSTAAGLAQQQATGRPPATLTFWQFLLRPKFITMLVIATLAFVLLITRKMNNQLKVPILAISTFLYGIAANLPVKFFSGFVMHPSPICSATKSILYGFRMPMIVTLAVILFLTLIFAFLTYRPFCYLVCPI